MAKTDKRIPRITPPSADPAETVERLLSRRQLKMEGGDALIRRVASGAPVFRANRASPGVEHYELVIQGDESRPERFATFGHAAARGEELATLRRTRLFYQESASDLPYLLVDARPGE